MDGSHQFSTEQQLQRRLSFLPLLAIIFFSTAGGPFGMEDLVSGGPGLALAIMASSWSMYNSLLLSNSRLPFAMAEDGLLPRWISRLHPARQTPACSLILCSAIYALFAVIGFRELVILDALVTAVTALLMITALAVLRSNRPDLVRPFRIPGGRPGLCLAGLSLTACGVALLYATICGSQGSRRQAAIAGGLLATGPVVYLMWNRLIRPLSARKGDLPA
ncbi:MAG: APC family permease [Planctomycetia bacterium]|nr:APC family permease [Planctomycetia bacterium]